ncbi:MAG TPA: hypothetical protein HPP83_12230, partial [Candidatus Hydrogenedentes bacterium]|nr:hypothetical protein [Candidatus Hydrogenedentota bacterium]
MTESTINESMVRVLTKHKRRQVGYRFLIVSSALLLLVVLATVIRFY